MDASAQRGSAVAPSPRGDAATPPAAADAAFWSGSLDAAYERLGATASGLPAAEAARRIGVFGANEAHAKARKGLVAKVLKRLSQPLVALLLIAGVVSGSVGDLASSAIIAAVVALSIALEIWQEHKAQAASDALQRSVALTATALRDGALVQLPVDRLVPGDVVELRTGDLAPADGLVIEARALRADEAALTGEPYPVDKRPGPSAAVSPSDAFDALFAGSIVVGGCGRMLVARTGASTLFGGLAVALSSDEPPTAFERGLDDLGRLIIKLTLFLALFVVLAQIASHRPALDAFLFALALAVGMTPELLPMVTTVTLARGAVRMAKRGVVAKKLSAIHDLGAMDVLCTDKTGTLTEARIALASCVDIDGATSSHVLDLAALNARLTAGTRSTLDEAIASAAPGAQDATLIAEAPFDFERRRSSVLVDRRGERTIVTKGAPEAVLAVCGNVVRGETVSPLDDVERRRILALVDAKAAEGLRCLAVAKRAAAGVNALSADDEHDLALVGFCFFADPIKASAPQAVARLAAQGVRVKILSGDAAAVVAHVARGVGVETTAVLTGQDLAAMTDAALAVQARDVDLFARLAPHQKVRVIRALSAGGSTVGFVGDGINDAPAIKAADAGVSVEGATDVARAAADLILLRPDLGVLSDGVAEGRRTHANILKYVRMATSSNFGNMVSMAIASVALPFLPLAPVQVLLNNLLYDVSEAGIPFDRVDDSETREPHGWDIRQIYLFTLVMGPLSSAFDIAAFVILRLAFDAGVQTFQTAWFLESMVTQILVVFVIRSARPVWASRPHRLLVASSLGALATACVLALTPAGAVFGFAAPPAAVLATMLAVSSGYLIAAELVKQRLAQRLLAARAVRRTTAPRRRR
jgi:Mg2+-importing ATPase